MAKIKKSHAGSKNPRALLDETQVITIRRLYKERSYSQYTLAITFGVSQSTISHIIRRQRWENT